MAPEQAQGAAPLEPTTDVVELVPDAFLHERSVVSSPRVVARGSVPDALRRLRDRDPGLAAQSIPAFARTVGVALRNVLHATPPPELSALPTLHVVVPRNTWHTARPHAATGRARGPA